MCKLWPVVYMRPAFQPITTLRRLLKVYNSLVKLAIHLSFLALRHVCALFREVFREIANQSLYTSHNITDFIHIWFCEKLDEKLVLSCSLMFRENTDRLARTTKCDMRKMISETVYEMPSVHFSFLFPASKMLLFFETCFCFALP